MEVILPEIGMVAGLLFFHIVIGIVSAIFSFRGFKHIDKSPEKKENDTPASWAWALAWTTVFLWQLYRIMDISWVLVSQKLGL